MQAYYEIETDITANHQLHIQLPDSIPQGRAKIAVIYELAEWQQPKKLGSYLHQHVMELTGGVELELPERSLPRPAPDFSDL
ncbi:MAG: hypothetical protein Q8Q50_12335 [Methylobacter sp.]|jgi:hypothetical protein|nr:hypothetical protein [Methylobacter sp.]